MLVLVTGQGLFIHFLLERKLFLGKLERLQVFFKKLSPQHSFDVYDIILMKANCSHSQIKNKGPSSQSNQAPLQQKWTQIRAKFAQQQQSVNEFQAADLIEEWILYARGDRIQEFKEKMKDKDKNKVLLRQAIQEALEDERQGKWLVTQKYSIEHANLITEKVISKYVKKVEAYLQQEAQQVQHEKQQQQVQNIQQQVSEPIEEKTHQESNTVPVRSTYLPSIRPKVQLYSPQQMASTFHLKEEITQDYQPRSPYLFEKPPQSKHPIQNAIYSNKYLKMVFQRFCKQSYNFRGMFSQFYSQSDQMNLNKWMVFCKQFDFNEKFHIKHLTQVYQQATSFSSKMNMDQFLLAVSLLQQKYIDKFHKGENFFEDILKINSQAAFRVKMQNLKVKYGGPSKDCWKEATYPEYLRAQEEEKQKQFKAKKKERDIVLIKGMYEEHLKDQIHKLREKRQRNKLLRIRTKGNQSMLQARRSDQGERMRAAITRIRPESLNYSKLLHIKQTPGVTNKDTPIYSTQDMLTPLYMTQHKGKLLQTQQKSSKLADIQQKNPEVNTQRTSDLPRREWIDDKNNTSVWLTRIRSDSQESDEILKEHLQTQKKMQKSNQSNKVTHLTKEMKENSHRVDVIKKQMEQDDDMIETGAQFRAKAQKRFVI